MKFLGSIPYRTVDGVRLKVRNRVRTWVIIPMKVPDEAILFEFFMDFAGRIIRRNRYGRQNVLPPPYIVERETAHGLERETVTEKPELFDLER